MGDEANEMSVNIDSPGASGVPGKIILVANTDWYLYHFRLDLLQMLRQRGWVIRLASPPGQYVDRLREAGFSWSVLPIDRKGGNPIRDLALLWRFMRLYRRELPDLCHHFTIKPALYGTVAARWVGKPRIVNSVTGLGTLFHSKGLWPAVRRSLVVPIYRSALNSSRVRLIFEHEADQVFFLQENLISPEQTHLIPGAGVDLQRFTPSAEPMDRTVALMASRMLWDKGVGEFVEAARLLTAWGEDIRMVIVGEPDPGNPTSVPPNQLEKWVADGLVEWWGRREDMPPVLAQANIVVLPSYSEGIPTVLLEAAASGRAMIATDIPGCREVVRDGVSGLLIPVKNPEALADAIRTLANDPELRSSFGAQARKVAEALFSLERVNERTIAAYHEALEQTDPKVGG